MGDDAKQPGVHDALVNAARLAHLALPVAKREALVADVERILAHVERMSSMDLAGVEPLVHPLDGSGVLRADDPGPALGTDVLMGMGPETHPPFVKVPKVIDGGGA
ncbi:MAG: hypothetical protein Tsb0013_20090 [Phycisphaerales bacterium]